MFFYRSGFASAALQTSAEVERLARRIQNKTWIRKASTLSGIVHSEAGNLTEAVMRYCDALRIARELQDPFGEVAVLINLASAFNYGCLHHEAIRCLNRAIALCDKPELEKYLAVAYCGIGQAYLALEDYASGFVAITRSLDVSSEPNDGPSFFSRTIREYTYVQLALEVGKLARAREHATACRHFSQWGDNPRCRTLSEIASGLCEIRGGDVDRGLRLLEQALISSGEFIASRIDALHALVKAYDETGNPERALHFMKELLSFVRRVREQSIAAIFANGIPIGPGPIDSSTADVRALELREARLQAKVAEHEVINTRLEMLERLAITADLKEEPSGNHGYRVGRLAALLAGLLGHDDVARRDIEVASRLHDIGKIGIPDRILLTSSMLKDAERSLMTSHAVIGAELLGRSKMRQLQMAEEIARHHHEWWDGTGYPSKLSGKRIPIHARIVALADVFDALTHGRPYAPAWPIERALDEIRQRRGTQFDPDLTDAFLALIEDLRREHADLDAFLGEASRNSPFLQAREKIRLMLEGERQAENIAAAAADTVH
jgi:putative two-component system response regulator